MSIEIQDEKFNKVMNDVLDKRNMHNSFSEQRKSDSASKILNSVSSEPIKNVKKSES